VPFEPRPDPVGPGAGIAEVPDSKGKPTCDRPGATAEQTDWQPALLPRMIRPRPTPPGALSWPLWDGAGQPVVGSSAVGPPGGYAVKRSAG
jgi:hypothetical protein